MVEASLMTVDCLFRSGMVKTRVVDKASLIALNAYLSSVSHTRGA